MNQFFFIPQLVRVDFDIGKTGLVSAAGEAQEAAKTAEITVFEGWHAFR